MNDTVTTDCRAHARLTANYWESLAAFIADDDTEGMAAFLAADGLTVDERGGVYGMLDESLEGQVLDAYATGTRRAGEWSVDETVLLLAWGGPNIRLHIRESGSAYVSVAWGSDHADYGVDLKSLAGYLVELFGGADA